MFGFSLKTSFSCWVECWLISNEHLNLLKGQQGTGRTNWKTRTQRKQGSSQYSSWLNVDGPHGFPFYCHDMEAPIIPCLPLMSLCPSVPLSVLVPGSDWTERPRRQTRSNGKVTNLSSSTVQLNWSSNCQWIMKLLVRCTDASRLNSVDSWQGLPGQPGPEGPEGKPGTQVPVLYNISIALSLIALLLHVLFLIFPQYIHTNFLQFLLIVVFSDFTFLVCEVKQLRKAKFRQ